MLRTPPRRLWPAILAVCSAALLVTGARLDVANPGPPAPAETTLLERRLQGGAGTELATRLYARAVRFANQLTWVPSAGASGVRWESLDTVLTTTSGGTPPVQRIAVEGGGLPVHDIFRGDLPPGDWLVAVARTSDGRMVWTAGIYGGKTTRSCGGATFGELQVSAALTDVFAGAALVDSTGRFVGMAVRCGGAIVAMSADGIGRTLALPRPEPLNQYGYRAVELAPEWRARFDRRARWVVTAVRDGSTSAKAGLRAGDALAASDPDPAGVLTVYRERRLLRVRVVPLRAAVRGLDLESADEGLKVTSAQPDSPAGQAGIRPGDIILRAGEAAGDPELIAAALAAPGPAFVILHRADRVVGVFLP